MQTPRSSRRGQQEREEACVKTGGQRTSRHKRPFTGLKPSLASYSPPILHRNKSQFNYQLRATATLLLKQTETNTKVKDGDKEIAKRQACRSTTDVRHPQGAARGKGGEHEMDCTMERQQLCRVGAREEASLQSHLRTAVAQSGLELEGARQDPSLGRCNSE